MDEVIKITGIHEKEYFDVRLKIDPSIPAFAQIAYLEIIKQIICMQQKTIAAKAEQEQSLAFGKGRTAEVIEEFHSSNQDGYDFSLDDLPY